MDDRATERADVSRYDALPGWQKPLVAAGDDLSLLMNGATFGFGDKMDAGLQSLVQGKDYDKALAEARRATQGARNRSGWAGTVAELAGGIKTAGNLLPAWMRPASLAGRAAPGLPRLAALTGGTAAEGAGLGALNAAGEDTDIGKGALVGGVLGALTPGALAILRNTFAPVFARLRPDQAASAAIETMVARSGRTPQQIVADLETAAREGQGGVYTAADALGNPGQRMLSTIARTPSDARSGVVEALESRQAGQGERVSNFLQEGFRQSIDRGAHGIRPNRTSSRGSQCQLWCGARPSGTG
jgi:hypothetical protein